MTTPCPAFPLKTKPALITVIMARPLAWLKTLLGMLVSGICRKSRMIRAQWSTVSCSAAYELKRGTNAKAINARAKCLFISIRPLSDVGRDVQLVNDSFQLLALPAFLCWQRSH